MAQAPHDNPRLGLVLALILMAIGGVLRGWAASWGYISDELCWIFPGGVYGNWVTGETAVNPPALRMVLAAITSSDAQILHLGRSWSVAAGTGAIGLMFWLGRLVGSNKNLPGLLAASYLTVLPLAIQQAGWYRSYATLLFVGLWHLVALVKVVDARTNPPQRSWAIHLMVSTALLPQVHYVGVAIVALEGLALAAWLREPRFLRYYVPAALLFAPLGYRIVTETSEHLAPPPDRLRNVRQLFEIVVHHPVLAALPLLGWLRLRRRQRVVLLGAVSSALGLLAIATYHYARLDLGIVPALYLIPLMATLPLLVPVEGKAWLAARGLAWMVVLVAFFNALELPVTTLLQRPRRQDGPPLLAEDLAAGRWPGDHRPIYLHVPSTVQPLYYYLHHRRLVTPCPVDESLGPVCFEFGGRIFHGFEGRDVPPSYVVVFDDHSHEQRLQSQCSLVGSRPPHYWIWDCPGGWKAATAEQKTP